METQFTRCKFDFKATDIHCKMGPDFKIIVRNCQMKLHFIVTKLSSTFKVKYKKKKEKFLVLFFQNMTGLSIEVFYRLI